jgi:hypothetical protein
MTAEEALQEAFAAGVQVTASGAHLDLEAAVAPRSAVIRSLAQHKSRILQLLQGARYLPVSLAGLPDRAWAQIRMNVIWFDAEHAAIARELGWTDIDLFAVHPIVGAARVDCCGALILARSRVVRVDLTFIRYANDLTFRKILFREPVVLAWEFGCRMNRGRIPGEALTLRG